MNLSSCNIEATFILWPDNKPEYKCLINTVPTDIIYFDNPVFSGWYKVQSVRHQCHKPTGMENPMIKFDVIIWIRKPVNGD